MENSSSNHHHHHSSSPSSNKSSLRINHQHSASAASVSPGHYRKPKKLHILNKMERERREQFERLKQSQQPIPTTTQSATFSSKSLSESMTRLSLDSSSSPSLLSLASSLQDPDKSSPQQQKSEDKAGLVDTKISSTLPLRPIPIHPSTFNNTLNVKNNTNSNSSTTIIPISSYDPSVKTNSSTITSSSIPKTPQSQKTKQFFKRKIISPMQNPTLVNEEAEDFTDISKRLAFDQKNVAIKVRPSIPPSSNSLTSDPPLSTPEKRLTKRITLHKKTSVTKAPDVPYSLKFVF